MTPTLSNGDESRVMGILFVDEGDHGFSCQRQYVVSTFIRPMTLSEQAICTARKKTDNSGVNPRKTFGLTDP